MEITIDDVMEYVRDREHLIGMYHTSGQFRRLCSEIMDDEDIMWDIDEWIAQGRTQPQRPERSITREDVSAFVNTHNLQTGKTLRDHWAFVDGLMTDSDVVATVRQWISAGKPDPDDSDDDYGVDAEALDIRERVEYIRSGREKRNYGC